MRIISENSNKQQDEETDLNSEQDLEAATKSSLTPLEEINQQQQQVSLNISEINVSISDFYFGLIDDCNDIDIPLFDMHLARFNLFQKLGGFGPQMATISSTIANQKQGSAEFTLSLNYFNRLLSGWEPLVEPWLARFNWKIKPTKNILTITSMDVLNINVTNTFVQLIGDVMKKWKADMTKNQELKPKRNKVFQPYKVINLTGQQLRFVPYQYNDATMMSSASVLASVSSSRLASSQSNEHVGWLGGEHGHLNGGDQSECEWITVNDKCEKQFSFLALNASKSKLENLSHFVKF